MKPLSGVDGDHALRVKGASLVSEQFGVTNQVSFMAYGLRNFQERLGWLDLLGETARSLSCRITSDDLDLAVSSETLRRSRVPEWSAPDRTAFYIIFGRQSDFLPRTVASGLFRPYAGESVDVVPLPPTPATSPFCYRRLRTTHFETYFRPIHLRVYGHIVKVTRLRRDILRSSEGTRTWFVIRSRKALIAPLRQFLFE